MASPEFADIKPELVSTNDDDLRTQRSELGETRPQLESESAEKKRNEKDEGEKLTQLEKKQRDKDEEPDTTKPQLESTKQDLRKKEDEFKKKELEGLQEKEEKLKQLEKQLHDKDKELSNTNSQLEFTKLDLRKKEDEFKKKELEGLQEKEEKLKQLEKQLHDKDKELSNTNSQLESTKQDLRKKEDEFKKKELEGLQEKEEKLKQLEKQLHDKDKELSNTNSQLESTKQDLIKTEDEFKKKELEGLQEKEEKLKQLEKQLHDKDKELSNTNSQLESTKQDLRKKEDEFKKKELEGLQEKEEKLKQLEKQLHDKDKKLSNTNSQLESTKQDLRKKEDEFKKKELEGLREKEEKLKQLHDKEKELDNTKSQLESTNDKLNQLREQFADKVKGLEEMKSKLHAAELSIGKKVGVLMALRKSFSECSSRWNEDCKKKEQAVEEAEQLRVTKEKADEVILGLQREKARLQWRHAFRLTFEQQWKFRVRAVVSAQCEEVKGQLTSMSRKHESDRKHLQDKIDSQNVQLYAARTGCQTQEAKWTDRIEQVEVEKAELTDKVTQCELQLKEREGSVQIAKAWVQRLSEQCGANERNLEELARTKTTLHETEAQYLDILEKLQKEKHNAVQLHLKLDSERRLNAALSNTAQREAGDVRQEQERIALLKDEIERAQQALRDAYRRNEEKCEELKTNVSEKRELVRHSLNLRRQLDAVTEDKKRLGVKCNHLEFELAQSPQHSPPNKRSGGNGKYI
ncbi:golgin subfamily A member 6-like protein 26 [Haliotis cracherodii]|uniref:golgin subfamily A member 6-like protein 26 n=1 Tax=Haliotis cracherodii TaxID=6455 RepID=UPI0039E8F00B